MPCFPFNFPLSHPVFCSHFERCHSPSNDSRVAMKHTTNTATKRKQQATVNNSKFISAANRSRKQQQWQFLASHTPNLSPLFTLTLIIALEYNTLCLRFPLTIANWKCPHAHTIANTQNSSYILMTLITVSEYLPLFQHTYSALSITKFCRVLLFTPTAQYNNYKPIYFRHYQISLILPSPAVYFNCPSTTNF